MSFKLYFKQKNASGSGFNASKIKNNVDVSLFKLMIMISTEISHFPAHLTFEKEMEMGALSLKWYSIHYTDTNTHVPTYKYNIFLLLLIERLFVVSQQKMECKMQDDLFVSFRAAWHGHSKIRNLLLPLLYFQRVIIF